MDNFLNAYGVWWLPGALLSAAAFIFAAVYGVCVGLSGYVAWNGSAGHVDPTGESILLGVCSFVLALIVLNFCISVLLDVVDCVFVCYVMDLDRQRRSRPEVHEVYEEVKAKTAKVPSGTGVHGAMDGRTRIGGGLQLRRQCRRSREGTGRKHRVRPRRRRCPLSLSETRVYEV